jgi:hypothetical protein
LHSKHNVWVRAIPHVVPTLTSPVRLTPDSHLWQEVQMKRSLALLQVLRCVTTSFFASGVGVLDASNAVYLRLDSSYMRVTVEGQISITTATQYFTNTHPPANR